MYYNHKIYSLVKRRCRHCGFSFIFGKEVGKTSLEGTNLSFIKEIGSPFHFRSAIKDGLVEVNVSKGGGDFISVSQDNLLKIDGRWYAAAQKVLNKTDGEPFFKGLIPHRYQYYSQFGGNKGWFEALELAPLEVDHAQKYWACKLCHEKIVAKREERRSQRLLLCDQKVGCSRIYFDPTTKEFVCNKFKIPFGVTFFKDVEGLTDREIGYISSFRVTIGGLYKATVKKHDDRLVVMRKRELL